MNPRLESFVERARERGWADYSSPKLQNMTEAFFEIYKDMPLPHRKALCVSYALENEPLIFDPDETIAGQMMNLGGANADPFQYSGGEDARWNEYSVAGVGPKLVAERLPEHYVYGRYFSDGAAPGHIGWDWRMVLEIGLEGLIDQNTHALETAKDTQSREYYECVLISLRGAVNFAQRIAQGAANELKPICEKVPLKPAESFREAVQSFWIQYLAVMYENPFGGNGPGLMDRFLWPYLEADLEKGIITLEEAKEIVLELFIKLDERISPADGWVEAVCVGGRDASGQGAENPLSYIMVECIMELNQTHPSIYMRLRDDAPADFRRLAANYLLHGQNRGQVYSDDRVIEALMEAGHRYEDAVEWMAGGCMEVSSQGRSVDFVFTFAHNTVWTLEAVLNGGVVPLTGAKVAPLETTLEDYATFDELWDAFETEYRRELKLVFDRLNIYHEVHAQCRPMYLISSMVHDCLERGRAINDGGARYSDFCGSCVGIPNVADSLLAIKAAVYDEGWCSAAQMREALAADFVGYEDLRLRLMSLPRFGQDIPEADAMANRVLEIYSDVAFNHVTPHGGRIRPIILGFVWVAQMGLDTGALPDGRRAHEPLAHGLAPQCSSATLGLSAAVKSATSLNLRRIGGGASMMFDLDPAWATPEVVEATLQTFGQRGGHIFQGNASGFEDLEAALEHPEDYKHLMVRVGGYSARFVNLTPELQNEIVARRRFNQ